MCTDNQAFFPSFAFFIHDHMDGVAYIFLKPRHSFCLPCEIPLSFHLYKSHLRIVMIFFSNRTSSELSNYPPDSR